MSIALQHAIHRAKSYRLDCCRSSGIALKAAAARDAIAAAAFGAGGIPGTSGFSEDARRAAQGYRAYRDHPFAAIRPIAVAIANLDVHVGRRKRENESQSLRTKNYCDQLLRKSPAFVRKGIAQSDLAIIDGHPIVGAIEEPNPFMTQWSLMYSTAVSICVTGRGYWWIVDKDDRKTGERKLQLWYMPSTWVTPVPGKEVPVDHWEVSPPNTTDSWPVPLEDMVPFMFPDPADPTQAFSPIHAVARAVNTDDKIQMAQFMAMVNDVRPGIMLVAGRLPGPPGREDRRPVLTPEQRSQLIKAIQNAYRGAHNAKEPLIVDGLIEDAKPYTLTPAEMDFLNSSQLTKDRIYQTIGTNPVVAGQLENANRASAYVAQDGFFTLVVNPIARLISETMTMFLGPRFAAEGGGSAGKLFAWLEKAEPHDADLQLSQIQLMESAGVITGNEIRKTFDLEPIDGLDVPKTLQPESPPPSLSPEDQQGGFQRGRDRRRGKSLSHKFNPNHDHFGRFSTARGARLAADQGGGLGGRAARRRARSLSRAPSSGGKARPAGRVVEDKTSDKSTRAKKSHKPSTKKKQQHAIRVEADIAKAVGGRQLPDGEPMDVIVGRGKKMHGLEVKTLVDNRNDKITVHPSSRKRKEKWSRQTGATLHTIIIDDRKSFDGGKNKSQHSGHRIYYRRGVGAFRLSNAHKVKNVAELKKLLRTPTAKLPKGAKSIEDLAISASAAEIAYELNPYTMLLAGNSQG